MRKTTCALALGLALARAAAGGTIVGTISARGPEAASPPAGGGGYAGLRYQLAERIDYDHLQDFVVSIDQPVADPGAGPAAPATVTQRDASFEPHVLAIAQGTIVRWPNADDIYHNVFSMSETKAFDLGLYTKEKVPAFVFDRVGQVDVFCSIHSRMHCIILVLPSRYFAKVNAHRRYAIAGVPAGTYRLKAWHERLPAQVREITVPATGEVAADFTLGFAELPKP